METHTIKTSSKVLSKKTLFTGTTKKIEVNKYWDSHGKEIDWGQDITNFDTEKKFEIVEEKVERDFGFNKYTFDEWHIFVDGKRFDTEFELTGYRSLKTKLVLHACVGAG